MSFMHLVACPTVYGKRASAVEFKVIDGAGTMGYAPSDDPAGPFFDRSDLSAGDTWEVTSVSRAGIQVIPDAGGRSQIIVEPGTATGAFSYNWALDGPAPTTGTKNGSLT